MITINTRINAEELNHSLVFKLKGHLVRAYLHAILSHAELLDEALYIQQVRKWYTILQTQLIVTLSEFIWGREAINEKLALSLHHDLVAADYFYFVYFCFEGHDVGRLKLPHSGHKGPPKVIPLVKHYGFVFVFTKFWLTQHYHYLLLGQEL